MNSELKLLANEVKQDYEQTIEYIKNHSMRSATLYNFLTAKHMHLGLCAHLVFLNTNYKEKYSKETFICLQDLLLDHVREFKQTQQAWGDIKCLKTYICPTPTSLQDFGLNPANAIKSLQARVDYLNYILTVI